MRCARVSAQEEHGEHWHVVRAGIITVAQGTCLGYPQPASESRIPYLVDPEDPQATVIQSIAEAALLTIDAVYGTDPLHAQMATAIARATVYSEPIPWSLGRQAQQRR